MKFKIINEINHLGNIQHQELPKRKSTDCKRTVLLRNQTDGKIAIVTLNLLDKILWTLQNIFCCKNFYYKFETVFKTKNVKIIPASEFDHQLPLNASNNKKCDILKIINKPKQTDVKEKSLNPVPPLIEKQEKIKFTVERKVAIPTVDIQNPPIEDHKPIVQEEDKKEDNLSLQQMLNQEVNPPVIDPKKEEVILPLESIPNPPVVEPKHAEIIPPLEPIQKPPVIDPKKEEVIPLLESIPNPPVKPKQAETIPPLEPIQKPPVIENKLVEVDQPISKVIQTPKPLQNVLEMFDAQYNNVPLAPSPNALGIIDLEYHDKPIRTVQNLIQAAKLEEAVEANKQLPLEEKYKNFCDIAKAYYQQDNLEKALETLEAVYKDELKHPIYKEFAQDLCRKGHYQDAIKCIKKVSYLDDNFMCEVFSAVAEEHFQQGDLEKALDIALQLKDKNLIDDGENLRLRVAEKYLEQDELKKAANAVEKILYKDKKREELLARIAKRYFEKKDFENAKKYNDNYHDLAAQKLLYIQIAVHYKEQGEENKALEVLKTIYQQGALLDIESRTLVKHYLEENNYEAAIKKIMASSLNKRI